MRYIVGGCNVVATGHGRYGLSCMQKLVGSLVHSDKFWEGCPNFSTGG